MCKYTVRGVIGHIHAVWAVLRILVIPEWNNVAQRKVFSRYASDSCHRTRMSSGNSRFRLRIPVSQIVTSRETPHVSSCIHSYISSTPVVSLNRRRLLQGTCNCRSSSHWCDWSMMSQKAYLRLDVCNIRLTHRWYHVCHTYDARPAACIIDLNSMTCSIYVSDYSAVIHAVAKLESKVVPIVFQLP